MAITVTDRFSGTPAVGLTDRLPGSLLLETGDYLLIETGDNLLLESTVSGISVTLTDRLPSFPT